MRVPVVFSVTEGCKTDACSYLPFVVGSSTFMPQQTRFGVCAAVQTCASILSYPQKGRDINMTAQAREGENTVRVPGEARNKNKDAWLEHVLLHTAAR